MSPSNSRPTGDSLRLPNSLYTSSAEVGAFYNCFSKAAATQNATNGSNETITCSAISKPITFVNRSGLHTFVTEIQSIVPLSGQSVQWYKALVMILLYVVYIIFMYFNRPLEKKSRALVKRLLRARAHSRISSISVTGI